MSKSEKIIFRSLVVIWVILVLRYFIWWISPEHIPSNFYYINNPTVPIINVLLFCVLTFTAFIMTVVKFASWILIWRISKPTHLPPEEGKRVAFLTCFVPGSEPVDMLEKTLQAIRNVNYPHDSWVLDEGNSEEVRNLAKELGVYYFSRKGIDLYNDSKGKFRAKTKAGNLNSWRHNYEHLYDYVAQIDMDHVPNENYLIRTLGYFKDTKIGFIVIPQIYKNKENWIAKGAAEQSYYFYGPIMKGLHGYGIPFLMGTTHVYRVKAMQNIDGYTPVITEDHLTGITFHANGWKSVYVDEVLAEGNGPLTWVDYFNQQLRWSYGLFQILFTKSPKLFKKMGIKSSFIYFLLQIFYFTGVAITMGAILSILYLLFGINSTNMQISDWAYYAIPPFTLAGIIFLFTHRFRIDPKNEPKYSLYGIILSQGASVIYTIAFLKFISRRKLTYMVTKKDIDSVPMPVPLSTFKVHISLSLLAVLALVLSFIFKHTSMVFEFWAAFYVLLTASVVISNYTFYLSIATKAVRQMFCRKVLLVRTSLRFLWQSVVAPIYFKKADAPVEAVEVSAE
jgi:cellulose synthase (UDP-forming)